MNPFGVTSARLTGCGLSEVSSVVAAITAVSSMSRRAKLKKNDARFEMGPLMFPSNDRL
jgi:hypothetical protein